MDTAGLFPSAPPGGRIGPNAVLQLIPVLTAEIGAAETRRLMGQAGLSGPPSDHGLMPEAPAHALHAQVRRAMPDRAAPILAEAGARTAQYILAHRIPRLAQTALRWMPDALAIRVLSQAIRKNAWTFAGSGRFAVEAPGQFTLAANPLIAGEFAARPLCHWHAAVFTGLFARLVAPDIRFAEVACTACGDPACRFVIA